MRVLWLIPLVIVLIVGAGLPVLGSAGVAAHPGAAFAAAAIALLASALAVIPLLLTRHSSIAARAQGGLVATLVHMMAAAALAGIEMKVQLGREPFTLVIYWLLPLYWSTLAILVVAIAKTLRRRDESTNILPRQQPTP